MLEFQIGPVLRAALSSVSFQVSSSETLNLYVLTLATLCPGLCWQLSWKKGIVFSRNVSDDYQVEL